VSSICGAEDQLCVTPTVILELISKRYNFEERRAAAAWIADNDIEVLPDTEWIIGKAWKFDTGTPTIEEWCNIICIYASASSLEELETGVINLAETNSSRLDLKLAETHREKHYREFAEQMITTVDGFVKGYANAISKGKFKSQPPEEERIRIIEQFSDPRVQGFVLQGTFERAKLAYANPPTYTPELAEQAYNLLWPYISAYVQYYTHAVLRSFKPQPNDFGDLELFLYLMDDQHKIATSEAEKWIEKIAKPIGLDEHVIVPAKVQV